MNIAAAIIVGASVVSAGTVALCYGRDPEPVLAPPQLVALSANQLMLGQVPTFFVAPQPAAKSATGTVALRPGKSLFRLPAQKQPAIGLGVYKTEPYSMLVLVPGRMPDDKSVHPEAPTDPRMPVIKPELRMVPWPKK